MGRRHPKKSRGKNVIICILCANLPRGDKMKRPDASANFSDVSKKCAERWRTMSTKEKGKLEDRAKADKAHYEREMKT